MSTIKDTEEAGAPPGEDSVLAGRSAHLDRWTVADAVAEHARARPDAPAVVESGKPAHTYAQLWDDASHLAGALREAGVERGDQVAIWATRTAGVVSAAVAAMSLGAAYLPIDPTYPAARVRRILEVGQPRVIVCADAQSLVGSLPRGVPTMDLHAGSRSAPLERPVAAPADVAYTVFTTGSTGLPKGVLVSHRALGNYLGWAQELTDFGPEDATPCFASLGFDHAVTCLWLPLMVGGSVQLIPDSWDPRPWLAPRERPFAFIKITPSHVRLFERIARPDYREVTRTVMFGGERLDAAMVASLSPRLDGVRLLNHYGPTEATVGCTAYRFDVGDVPAEGSMPIGVPVWNSRAYLVDEHLSPVPAGEEGELVLGGACVAEGYLGGGDEDRARFLDEAAVTGAGATAGAAAADGERSRAYRTGDRCVVRDGVVHYMGRLDEQVKVRGHRIEIQEVHDLVVSVDGVQDAAVVVSQAGLGGLELFVTTEDGADDPVARVLEHLRANLPAAAVPGHVLVVPHLVANAHGKFDPDATRALAAPATGTGAGGGGPGGEEPPS
ncbi:MAG: amino acid adenylation domain-containing protein [Acidimicrobiales bacterium]